MKELFIQGGTIFIVVFITAVIAFSIYKGDFFRTSDLPAVPDDLELRRRENETMLRHERRGSHQRHLKILEK